jgi:hypothetical protein
LGCSVILEKKAKETILENIKKATSLNVNQYEGQKLPTSNDVTIIFRKFY